jgi:putative CocE/NonD family hydrolase
LSQQQDGKAWKLGWEERPISYNYDPENPVYTKGSESMLATIDEIGSKLQPEPGYREDVISFVSDTLTEDIRIGGRMNVKLYVSSDCDDTCFTAKVMEVLPNGEAYHVRSSLSTLAYRNNARTRLEYRPGEVVEINIDLLPVIWNIKAGSRVRVDISSSSFPEYSIHSNYAGVWSLQDKTRVAHQQIHIGGSYPSVLEIPILS